MRPREDATLLHAGKIAGMKTRELAGWVKSWNSYEAALELAAINSALNAPAVVGRNCGALSRQDGERECLYLSS